MDRLGVISLINEIQFSARPSLSSACSFIAHTCAWPGREGPVTRLPCC